MEKLLRNSETYSIIGLCMEVHKMLGFGFSEIVYKDALEIEAILNEVSINREKQFDINYKGKKLKHKYFADFVMFENIIVEIKATHEGITDKHISQTLNYMKASGSNIGLIFNFGKKSLEYKRLVF
ncbi:MAG: GxxExxY protein [Chitinophagaceae bacterium]|nr:GxxExxY protein [Chitinophagaceae bacterium]